MAPGQKKRGFASARGQYSHGASYEHPSEQNPHNKTQKSNPRVCKYFLTPRGCDKGESCPLVHENTHGQPASANPRLPAAPQKEERPQSELWTWIRMVPESISKARPLGQKLPHFFRLAWRLVSKGETGTRQQVVTKLASEGGLHRIKEFTDTKFENLSDGRQAAIFEEAMIPFFRAISHEDVLSSLLLETAVDTIYNFLFGPSGRRAIKLFTYAAPTLRAIASSSKSDIVATYIEASLAVLQKIVDLNSTALIMTEFQPLLQTISQSFGRETAMAGNQSVHRSRQSLASIQRRLDLGSAMSPSQVASKNITDPLVTFEISQDMPGSLSGEGPRHDNDHQDITDIKIMPTTQEIQSHRLEYLPFRDPGAWHLPGIKGLLDRQFRLLREDTVGQLRDAVGLEIERLRNADHGGTTSRSLKQGPRTIAYKDADLTNIEFDKWKGLQVAVEFDQPPAVLKMSPAQRRDWWENSKQLQADSLLCFVEAEGGTIFLSAADQINARDGGSTSGGHGTPAAATVEGPIEPRNLFNHPQRAVAILRPVDTYRHDITRMVNNFMRRRHSRQSLVEFPGVLLPSFRPTLQALQQMSRDTELPFSELLAPPLQREKDPQVPPPSYALREGFRFDLSCLLTNGGHLTLSPGKRFDHQALQRASTLDEAQAAALVDALCRSLALVQGPPGTGKSFTGIALIKVLLKNRERAYLGPIICVCYTNHALDQLLEHLVHDGIQSIIRLGSRSKSQILEPLNLRQVSQQQSKTKTEKHREWELRKGIDSDSLEMEGLLSDLKQADSWKSVKTYLEANHPHHHDELFGDTEDDGFQTVHHDLGKLLSKWLHPKAGMDDHQGCKARHVRTLVLVSLQEMNREERQKLHRHWIAEIIDCLRGNLRRALKSYTTAKDQLNHCRQELNLRCLQQAHVVGVTTTGLAKNLDILRRLRSKVMLCEEAGEVLEAHTITALLPHIEHSILIGDHQQLRPQTQNYELQNENPFGEKYSLDVSLFERLVQPKGDWGIRLPFSALEIQRRMHPSIAQLVRDTLYPKLQDHPSVTEHSEVFGLRKRLFWLDHQEPEAGTDPSRMTSTSHSNDFEIDMTAALVSHLVRQGEYQSDDIAVLTPYRGQLQKMKKRMSRSYEVVIGDRDAEELVKEGLDTDDGDRAKPSVPQKTTLLKALRIATVDNFQGEEAKVVVVSLVRSNPRNNCGFLKTSNRINVLLSRARHGMYIIGNSQTSRHVPMWAEVLAILKADENIGQSLPLRCARHPDTTIEVSTPDDFSLLAPEGGCNKKCNLRLSCGHSCINKCHSEPLHNVVICLEPCRKPQTGCDHPCPRPCGQECEQQCQVKLTNITLLCGHVRARLECHKAQNLSKVRCEKQVERNVPGCEHTINVPCCVDVAAEDFQCGAICGETLPCGHTCLRKCKDCNVRTDHQIVERNHGACRSQCGRPYNNCAHRCTRPCHGEESCPLCEAPCEVQCGHSRCHKKCQEPCAPCAQDCSWSCPHRGRCQMPCAVPCDILPCSKRCGETLSCGHQCPSVCGEKCPPTEYCQICASESVKGTVVDYILQATYGDVELDEDPVIVPSCRHLMALSSMDGHMEMSEYYELSPSFSVEALKPLPEAFSTENVKKCPMCRGSLRDINRYNRIVRQSLIEEATKKFISWANQCYLPLEKRLYEEETRLQRSVETGDIVPQQPSGGENAESPLPVDVIRLEKSAPHQIDIIRKYAVLKARYKPIATLKGEVSKFLKQVSEGEQPFGRIFDMIQDVRRRRGIATDLAVDRNVLNTRNRMLASLLSIRCDLAVLSDFFVLRQKRRTLAEQHSWIRAELHLDFSKNRQICEDLIAEAIARDQPMLEVEARVFFIRWSILERSAASSSLTKSEALLAEAKQQVGLAQMTCQRCPGQTQGMLREVSDVDRTLKDMVFYTSVDNEEKRQVYAAMAREFTGTGHWYTCANGHPFTVGECGMPMQTSVCPQCGAPVGGQSHQPAAGVTHARDFEERFGAIRLH